MAVITADTFDPLRQYVAVRLQQGVPLVDADWNELDDVRKFEVRAFLKWFMGDGVPAGSDGFRIEGTGLLNNFVVRAGVVGPADALNNVGRILVDGRDAIITGDFNFTSQPLHVSQPGSTALAAALGVPQIQPLTTPVANGNVVAYLDVWERLVTPVEDPTLVLPGIGAESCARLKRERVVRVRAGTAAPVSGGLDFIVGHSYLALATIARSTGVDAVTAANVTDRRRTGLTVAAFDTRIETLERLTLRPSFLLVPNQFVPKVGPAGIQQLTIQGRNFLVGTSLPAVQIGGAAATLVGAPTATQIVVTVPLAAPVGAQSVRVTTQGGTVLSDEQFNVLAAPVPSFLLPPNQFNPKVGPNSVQMVTLNGANFNVAGLVVRFGAVVVTNITSIGPTQIVCQVPAMAPGVVNITVTTNAGTVVSTDTFNVL